MGATINVLIALTCAAISKQRIFDARLLGRLRAEQYENEDRLAQAGIALESEVYLARTFVSFGTRLLVLDETTGTRSRVRQQHSAGWPLLALRAEQITARGSAMRTRWGARMGTLDLEFQALPVNALAAPAAATPPTTAPGMVTTAPALTMSVAPRQKAEHLLPLRPLWPGFAINTLVFAGAAWLVWLMLAAGMSLQRRLRCRCGNCGYPIGISPVCTECGRKVRMRDRTLAKLSA